MADPNSAEEQQMVIVAGHIVVDPQQRESYLADCVSIVKQARLAAGCLDFAITADLVDVGRIDIFERWESRAAVEAFRGSGPPTSRAPRCSRLRWPSTTSRTCAR
jgi:quinol monooxygenase YgiN